MIDEFYSKERVCNEITTTSDSRNGWYAAIKNGQAVGAIGCGEGIGTQLLQALPDFQKNQGATEQWVSVGKG
jgi:hypothetical protein